MKKVLARRQVLTPTIVKKFSPRKFRDIPPYFALPTFLLYKGFKTKPQGSNNVLKITDLSDTPRGTIWFLETGYLTQKKLRAILTDESKFKMIYVRGDRKKGNVNLNYPLLKSHNILVYVEDEHVWLGSKRKPPSNQVATAMSSDARYPTLSQYRKSGQEWEKNCKTCKKWKKVGEFHKQRRVGKLDDHRATCKACRSGRN